MAKQRWQKLLYVRQDFPDNQVDQSFLQEMRKNVNVHTYDYLTLVRNSGTITQHFSSILVFIVVFLGLYETWLSPARLLTGTMAMTAAEYLAWKEWTRRGCPEHKHQGRHTLKTAALFVMTLLGLSPILKTLTEDTSSDTIWALAVILFLINAAFHDYASRSLTSIQSSGSMALNAAIFASVVLASRLPTKAHVFALMAFAVHWFALFPIFRRSLKCTCAPRYDLLLTISMFLLTGSLLAIIFMPLVFIYIAAMILCTFIGPYWLIYLQKYKNEIHGPWDEASLVLSSSNLGAPTVLPASNGPTPF